MSFFSAGVSALNNAQLGLTTTGHNINNVNTAGFHRQENVQVTNIPLLSGSGFIGQGAHVTTIKRTYSQFLDGALSQAQTQASQFSAYLGEISQVDSMLADTTTGVSPALQDFFKTVGDVAASPESVPARQALIGGANALVSRFNTIAQRFTELTSSVNNQIAESVGVINSYAQQIATLNNQITFQTGGTAQPANDLLDQREHLISELNKQIRTTTITQSDGSVSLFIGTGQPLVVGPQIFGLSALRTPEDQQRIGVAYTQGSALIPDTALTGGVLGGLLDYRANALYPAENLLGRVALGLAQSFNDQHRLGQDLTGNMGGDFFHVPTFGAIASAKNTGAGTINTTMVDMQSLTSSDYRLVYTGAVPVGSEYKLTRLSDSTTTTISAVQMAAGYTVDGITYQSAGGSNANDSFLIQPTRYAARDIALSSTINSNTIAAAAPIRASALLANTGSGKISAGAVNPFNNKVTLTFTSATAFNVVDVTTGITLAQAVPYTSGANISYNGWTTQISNGAAAPFTPLAGDVFTVDRALTSHTTVAPGSTASIAVATLPSAPSSPIDPFLKNTVKVVFDTATSYHLEGQTNNVTGVSTITVGAGAFAPALPLVAGANPGITITGGTAAVGTGGAGSYAAAGTKTTVTGGTVTVAGPPSTIIGATVTVEGGGKSTTFSGLTLTLNAAGDISIPAVSGAAIASTFNGQPATGLTFTPNVNNLLSVNGWNATLSGTPAAGDAFTISANSNGVSDNRNALLLGQLQTKGILVGGTTNFQDAYAEMVSQVGNQTAEVQVTSKAQDTLVKQATSAQQAISGVNLDEEAANLLRFQQAYQAAGKMMSIAATLFDTLLSIGR